MDCRCFIPIFLSVLAGVFSLSAQETQRATVVQSGLDPVPEQAFSRTSAPSTEVAGPGIEQVPTEGLFATPAAALPPTNETAFSELINAGERPTPFYQRWLNSFFDLVAPGEPYMRDKLVFVLGTSAGYDNNVLYSPTDQLSSATYGVNGAMDYHFGSRRLKIDAKLTGGINYYENRPGGSNDQNYALLLALDYQLMPRLGFSFNTNTAYLSQPAPQLVGGIFRYSGSYLYTDTSFALNYQLRPRFGLTATYEVSGFKYDDQTINQGSGFYQQNFSLSGNWLFSPRTSFVLQYRYNPVTYYEAGGGSVGQLLLVGINQSLSSRFNFSLTGGAEYRTLEGSGSSGSSSYLGPFVEGTLSYNFTPDSAINGTMRYGTEPSGSDGSNRRTFRTSLGVAYKLGMRVTLGADLGFERDDYDQTSGGVGFTQDVYSAGLSCRYELAIATSIVLRDNYLIVDMSTPNSSYERNYISLGLEVTF